MWFKVLFLYDFIFKIIIINGLTRTKYSNNLFATELVCMKFFTFDAFGGVYSVSYACITSTGRKVQVFFDFIFIDGTRHSIYNKLETIQSCVIEFRNDKSASKNDAGITIRRFTACSRQVAREYITQWIIIIIRS